MWFSTRSLRKTLNQLSLVSNFDFLDINSPVAWDKFIFGTSEQTAKISKTGFAKIGQTAISKPQWVGFSSTKTDYDKFESWGKKFSISLLDFFSPESLISSN